MCGQVKLIQKEYTWMEKSLKMESFCVFQMKMDTCGWGYTMPIPGFEPWATLVRSERHHHYTIPL